MVAIPSSKIVGAVYSVLVFGLMQDLSFSNIDRCRSGGRPVKYRLSAELLYLHLRFEVGPFESLPSEGVVM